MNKTATLLSAMGNSTTMADLPPLPAVPTATPVPHLLPFITDFWLSLLLPHFAYWVVSGIFHVIDVYDLFPQYRLHTPVEITQRNLASRADVLKNVLFEQFLQLGLSTTLSYTDEPQMMGMEDYDVAVWARRIRVAQRGLPKVLGFLGLNAPLISKSMSASHPLIAGALAGGYYPFLTTVLDGDSGMHVPAFATWEVLLAKAIYWLAIPGIKLFAGIVILDTWQYFWHRAMHLNQWMYSKLRFHEETRTTPADQSQHTSTRTITASMYPTRTALSIIIGSKASCWTPLASAWPTSSPS